MVESPLSTLHSCAVSCSHLFSFNFIPFSLHFSQNFSCQTKSLVSFPQISHVQVVFDLFPLYPKRDLWQLNNSCIPIKSWIIFSMLLAFFTTFLWFQVISAEHSARELDSLLQEYAFRAFVRPRTGIVYNANVPSNLTGVQAAAVRLRSGSLRRRGVDLKEFHLPIGFVAQPHVKRLVLVYHNLGNWSSLYYPLPGYTFLAPILGLLAYDASNLSASNLSELDVRASGDPISITFPGFGPVGPEQSSPMCVHFGLDGSVGFDNVVNGSACLTTNQGHFSIVAESLVAPAPAPASADGEGVGIGGGKGGRKRVWVIAVAVVGGAAVLVALGMVFAYVKRCRRRKKIRRMEDAVEVGVALPMTSVGNTKAPVALETRTRPFLENEFVP